MGSPEVKCLDEYLIAFRGFVIFGFLYGHDDTRFEIPVLLFPIVYVTKGYSVSHVSCNSCGDD